MAIAKLPKDGNRRLAAIVDMLVPVYETKIFYAWLELVVASRTDLALRSAVRQVSKEYTKRVLGIWKELFGCSQWPTRRPKDVSDARSNRQLANLQ